MSTWIWEGQRFPSLLTASRKRSRTVWARLLELHLRNLILRENPSIHPCMTNFQRINEWWPSRCQKEFGHGTWYVLRKTWAPHLIAVFLGSTQVILSLIRLHCTLSLSDFIYLAMYPWPDVAPWLDIWFLANSSSSWSVVFLNSLISCSPNFSSLLSTVHLDTPNILAILSQVKLNAQSSSSASEDILYDGLSGEEIFACLFEPKLATVVVVMEAGDNKWFQPCQISSKAKVIFFNCVFLLSSNWKQYSSFLNKDMVLSSVTACSSNGSTSKGILHNWVILSRMWLKN